MCVPDKLGYKFRLEIHCKHVQNSNGEQRTWCEKSASIIITKSPLQKLSP